MVVPYKNTGPIDSSVAADLSKLKGKTVIVTGGSSGLGAGYVRGFLDAGCHVINADVQESEQISASTESKYLFVKCDVTVFADQVNVFKHALKHSPDGKIDVVVANAGISGADSVWNLNPDTPDPEEPDLKILNIDLIGVLYTARCAMHYWQFDNRKGDEKCFIIKSSLAGYLAVSGATQYSVSKYGVRGLMIQMRMADRCRTNLIAPWFISTPIMSDAVKHRIGTTLEDLGSGWAEVEDAVKAVLRVASDQDINGKALAIVPKSMRKEGYMDCVVDDYPSGSELDKMAQFVRSFQHRHLPKDKQ